MATMSRWGISLAAVIACLVVPAEFSVLVGTYRALQEPSRSPEEWVAAHAAELPRTSVEIKSLPVSVRKAVFRALPPMERSMLWRAHFADYVQAHDGITTEQLDVLNDACELMSPDNLVGTNTPEVRSKATEIISRAMTAFPAEETNELFYWFGPRRPLRLAVSATLRKPSMLQTLAELYTLDAKRLRSCSCNQDAGCGVAGPTCDHAGGPCATDSTWPACGFLWMWDCDGSSC